MPLENPDMDEVEGFLKIVWPKTNFDVRGQTRATYRLLLKGSVSEDQLEAIKPWFEVTEIKNEPNNVYLEITHRNGR